MTRRDERMREEVLRSLDTLTARLSVGDWQKQRVLHDGDLVRLARHHINAARRLPEWVDATIDPDQVIFSRNVVDATGMDRQSYSVNRSSLTMAWRWLSTPTGAAEASVDASAHYQSRLIHTQF